MGGFLVMSADVCCFLWLLLFVVFLFALYVKGGLVFIGL
jgi:hypothetical protein